MLMVAALTGCCTGTKPQSLHNEHSPPVRRFPNLLAHIEHDDLHFSVSLNPAAQSFLTIHIAQRDSIKSSPTVHVRAQMTDEKIIEGDAQKPRVWYGNGGWSELDYRFQLRRSAVIDDIHSVTITINEQQYELCPF